MKKVILLVIGCLAYVSVQAQSTTSPEQIKKVIDTKLKTITSKVDFSENQKTFLNTYVAYIIKSNSRGFRKEAEEMNIKKVDLNTFFSLQQNKVIKDELLSLPNNILFTHTGKKLSIQENKTSESPKTGF